MVELRGAMVVVAWRDDGPSPMVLRWRSSFNFCGRSFGDETAGGRQIGGSDEISRPWISDRIPTIPPSSLVIFSLSQSPSLLQFLTNPFLLEPPPR
jgi:hypothetical protein